MPNPTTFVAAAGFVTEPAVDAAFTVDAAFATAPEAPFELTGGVPSELLEQAQRQARAVGYAQGWAQGLHEAAAGKAIAAEQTRQDRAAASREQAEQVTAAVRSLLAAADRLDRTAVELTDELSDRMLAAAVELAAVLVGERLADAETSAGIVLRRVLAEVPDGQPITVKLGQRDYDTLTGPNGTALIAAVDATAAGRISLECDPALPPGDAQARLATSSIDARLTTALARLREYAG